jgi:hypothetical protein
MLALRDVHEAINTLLDVFLGIPIRKAVLYEVDPPGLLRRNENEVVEPIIGEAVVVFSLPVFMMLCRP